ncbi:MAG: NTP transferase domain-containing protein [Oscillospiraceae bacterium]|nr:NTP transferase domain-containing protein [Oscillospiraceae bacterium]
MRATTAIILAAGLSSRMGAQKLLLPVGGKPMLQHGLDLVESMDFTRCVLVTTPEVASGVGTGAEIVINPAPEAGQSGSVRLGVLAAAPGDSLLFLTGDQPFLDAATLAAILAADDGESIVYPVGPDGMPRSPVLFGAKFREELLSLQGDEGGRQIRRRYPAACRAVRVTDERVLADIDTPREYDRVNSPPSEGWQA